VAPGGLGGQAGQAPVVGVVQEGVAQGPGAGAPRVGGQAGGPVQPVAGGGGIQPGGQAPGRQAPGGQAQVRATAAPIGNGAAGPAQVPTAQGQQANANGAVTKPVNTTNLSYLPDPATLNEELPSMNGSNKRTIEEAGLLFPERERDGVRWRAAHVLGSGAMGRVGLRIGSNETNVIVDVQVEIRDWRSPISWRDRLPREIAIQVRLNKRRAYEHNVHRYY
jgi:hypothetical protein